MSNFIVYILTDNNRKHFKIDFTSNILSTALELQQTNNFIFQHGPSLTRIIYTETFSNLGSAKKKMNELKNFTSMQIEKIVRKHNPNWHNLFPQQQQTYPKGESHYAA
jgi:putative endonuclease